MGGGVPEGGGAVRRGNDALGGVVREHRHGQPDRRGDIGAVRVGHFRKPATLQKISAPHGELFQIRPAGEVDHTDPILRRNTARGGLHVRFLRIGVIADAL